MDVTTPVTVRDCPPLTATASFSRLACYCIRKADRMQEEIPQICGGFFVFVKPKPPFPKEVAGEA